MLLRKFHFANDETRIILFNVLVQINIVVVFRVF